MEVGNINRDFIYGRFDKTPKPQKHGEGFQEILDKEMEKYEGVRNNTGLGSGTSGEVSRDEMLGCRVVYKGLRDNQSINRAATIRYNISQS